MNGSKDRKQRQLDLNRLLGQRLAALRKTGHIRQVDVAQTMRVQRSLISKMEHGDHALDAMEVSDYARALGIAPAELFEVIDSIVVEYDGGHRQGGGDDL